jgi:hypothetical protein
MHLDDSNRKPPARRKSGGNTSISEEGRLAKRKEQNRAAQRAFRDRKEKHVRDVCDIPLSAWWEYSDRRSSSRTRFRNWSKSLQTRKVKTPISRTCLSGTARSLPCYLQKTDGAYDRLQNENMMLKQSAFTFEFSPTNKVNDQTTSPTANTASSFSSASTNPFTSPSHSGSSASPESSTSNYVSKSPNNSLFNASPSPNMTTPSESQDSVTVNSAGFMSFATTPNTAQPTPETSALAMSSPGAGPSSISQNAFTQNSLFTSYRDPSSYSLGLPFGDFNTLATPSLAAEFGMDLGMDMSMGNDLGAFGLGSDFDDLFGGQLGALDGTSSYGGVGSVTSPTGTSLMTPQSANVSTPQSGAISMAQSSAPTPASQPLIIDGLPSAGESARVECSIKAPSSSDWRRCPKNRQEFVDLVRHDSSKPSTFGPALGTDDKAKIEQEWQQFKQRPEFQVRVL